MSGTRNQFEELRQREDKIHELRDKKQKQRLAKMPKNPHCRKRHARRIGKRIPDKHPRGIAIEVEQSERRRDERQHHRGRKHVILHVVRIAADEDVNDVDEQKRASDHDRLSHFESVDACVNVDAVRAENAQHYDVNVVPSVYFESSSLDYGDRSQCRRALR